MVPKQTLHSELYMLIYKALKEAFLAKEWAEAGGEPGEKLAVWDKRDNDGKLTLDRLFQVKAKYFYERNAWAKEGEEVTLRIELLDKILKYMGCQGLDHSALLKDFYRLFNVPQEVINQQEAIKNAKKEAKNKAGNSYHQTVSAENIHGDTINIFHLNSPTKQIDEGPAAAIYRFYEHIAMNSKDGFESAWGLLSESFQQRIWGKADPGTSPDELKKIGIERFKQGYFFFRSLRETHVFNVKIYPATAHCLVYYEDDLELPYIEELADISRIAIKNTGTLIKKLNAVSRHVERLGGSGFSDKALARLFYATPTENLWFEHGMDPVAFKASFPVTSVTSISRLFKCRCVKVNDNWLIDGLIPLHCRHI